MLGRRAEGFPAEAARDLLGLVRAIYAARKAARAGRPELQRIERVGAEVADALALAAESRPDTVGMRAATAKAERAALDLGDLVGALDAAEPIVRAAMERVRAAGGRR